MAWSEQQKRDYQRAWKQRRRAEFFAGKCCTWCGSVEDLQLHHLDPKAKETHRIWSYSAERRLAEIAKCIVLCWPCHIHWHVEQRRKPQHEIDADMRQVMANMDAIFGSR
jgi:5-methylcytosine-specific restriction endonuclease McrA